MVITKLVSLIAIVSLLNSGLIVLCDQSPSNSGDISLWIDEKQVKEYSGFPMKIHVIVDGSVLPYVTDPNFEKYLPVIPAEVSSVNFTWKGGDRKLYNYHFDRLMSRNESILGDPIVSIATKGPVPQRAHVFSVKLPCSGNVSGVASFSFGLRIFTEAGLTLPGTPLRLNLQKQCAHRGPDPECDRKCANGASCNLERICECPEGYIGQYCDSALCYPVCMNGGTCAKPGTCVCSDGYQGPHCEGGICREKCLNGGKCVQKDTCSCRKGYYGPRCEYSKCSIPCLNEGRCIGVNRCRCRPPFAGAQCEKRLKKGESSVQLAATANGRKPNQRKKKKKFV
ncbi:Protein shifted [Halotydeus destructor]|nr:Protein shifted [Halotydeus destructor]